MRVLPNSRKSNKSSTRTRRGPHSRTDLLWRILFASIAIDPLLPVVVYPVLSADVAIQVAVLLALAAVPFLAQGTLHSILSKLRVLHAKTLRERSRLMPILVALATGGIVVLKILILLQLPPIISVILLIGVIHAVTNYVLQTNKQAQNDQILLESNPLARVQRWEQQIIIFVTLPILLARGIGLCGAVAELSAEEQWHRFVYTAISALFLAMLRPDKALFVSICKRCKHPVPIAFTDIGSCLNCDPNLRLAFRASIHNAPLPLGETTPPTKESTPDAPPQGRKSIGRNRRPVLMSSPTSRASRSKERPQRKK